MEIKLMKVLPILGGIFVFLAPLVTAQAVLLYRVDRVEQEVAGDHDRLADVCTRLARIEGKLDVLLNRTADR